MTRQETRNMILCALFAALSAAGAFLRVPIPVVPFTLQTLFTLLAGMLLGPKLGATAVGVYIVLGLAGLPVFTQGGGPSYIFQPTFGYIIGFAIGAYVTGKIAHAQPRPSLRRLLVANLAGLAVIYACGMVYYYLISLLYLNDPIGLWPLFVYCFLLTIPGDLFLCVVGAVLSRRLIPLLQTNQEVFSHE